MFWKRSRTNVSAAVAKADEMLTPDSTLDGNSEELAVVKGRDPDYGTSTTIKTYYEGKGSANGHCKCFVSHL